MRRSSRSVGAQIAEAWGKRRYEKHFVSKLTDADAEVQETQHWTATARDCGYFSDSTACELDQEMAEIGRMLKSMVDKAHLFCGDLISQAKENSVEYFAIDGEDS